MPFDRCHPISQISRIAILCAALLATNKLEGGAGTKRASPLIMKSDL